MVRLGLIEAIDHRRLSDRRPTASPLKTLLRQPWIFSIVFFLSRPLLFLFYFTYLTAHGEMTLGKASFRLKVVRRGDEQELGLARAFGRACAYGVSALPFFLGFFMAFVLKGRAFHDILAGHQGGARRNNGRIGKGQGRVWLSSLSSRGLYGDCGCSHAPPFASTDIGSFPLLRISRSPATPSSCPGCIEDKSGEVYSDAFREYWAGSGKTIWIENDRLLGLSPERYSRKDGQGEGHQGGKRKGP